MQHMRRRVAWTCHMTGQTAVYPQSACRELIHTAIVDMYQHVRCPSHALGLVRRRGPHERPRSNAISQPGDSGPAPRHSALTRRDWPPMDCMTTLVLLESARSSARHWSPCVASKESVPAITTRSGVPFAPCLTHHQLAPLQCIVTCRPSSLTSTRHCKSYPSSLTFSLH